MGYIPRSVHREGYPPREAIPGIYTTQGGYTRAYTPPRVYQGVQVLNLGYTRVYRSYT